MEKCFFTPAEDAALIELVRVNHVLYDRAHFMHKDGVHKEYIWEKMGLKMGRTPRDCKKRWKSIKDTYDMYKKRQASVRTLAIPFKTNWHLISRVSFLDFTNNKRLKTMKFFKKALEREARKKVEKTRVQKEGVSRGKKMMERNCVQSGGNRSKEEEVDKSEIVGGGERNDELEDGTNVGSGDGNYCEPGDESDGESGGDSDDGSESDSDSGSGGESDGEDDEIDEEDDEEYDEEDGSYGEEDSDGDEEVEGDKDGNVRGGDREKDVEGAEKRRRDDGGGEREIGGKKRSVVGEHVESPVLQTVPEPFTVGKRPMFHEEILAKRPKYTTTVLESILEQHHNVLPPERMNEVYRLHDSVDLFFDSVAANVKKFPNRVINEVKIKVTTFMAQLEDDYAWCFQTLPTNYEFYGYAQPTYASPVPHHVDGGRSHVYGNPNGVLVQHPATQYKSYNDY